MSLLAIHQNLATQISRYSQLCYDRRLVGAAGGNLSVRLPDKKGYIVTASGVALRDVNPDNLVVIDDYGNVWENPANLRPSKEIGFHLEIFRIRPDVQAIVHVHPPYATVFSTANRKIPLATVSASLKLKQGSVAAEAHPGSHELRQYIVATLQEAPSETSVLLMERHGLVSFNTSLCQAFDDAELAEDTAKIAYLSSQWRNNLPFRTTSFENIIDLTAPLNESIQCYPSDPPFQRSWFVQIKDTGMNVSKLAMGAHCGTHVDAPLHFQDDGGDITTLPLRSFMGPGIVINSPKKSGENISLGDLNGVDIHHDTIVLFHTGWEDRANSPRFFEDEWPGFDPEVVQALLAKKVKAIGGDIPSLDSPQRIRQGAPAHKLAAKANLPAFEALINLESLTGKKFTFIGLPLRLDNCEASPIRAIAMVDSLV